MKFVSISSVILLSLFFLTAKAQDFSWWNRKVNWDGYTHWRNYLIFAPGYMGPNALPVPLTGKGVIQGDFQLEQAMDFHHTPHEYTQNYYLRCYFPVAGKKAALEVIAYPAEYYRYDTLIRDRRASRDFDGEGFAAGDVYVISHFQLIRNHRFLPDLLLTTAIKTASGGNSQGARYTDSPGYYFNGSFNHPFKLPIMSDSIRWYGMMGFYSWQTTHARHFQNDAFLAGTGLTYPSGKWEFDIELAGYFGYTGKGDQPVVIRTQGRYKSGNMLYGMMVQKGLHHFDFLTFRFSVTYCFNQLADKIRNKRYTGWIYLQNIESLSL